MESLDIAIFIAYVRRDFDGHPFGKLRAGTFGARMNYEKPKILKVSDFLSIGMPKMKIKRISPNGREYTDKANS